MSQLLDDLKAVRDLLSVPERWTKGAHARDLVGHTVPPAGVVAVCWCLDGAALKLAGGDMHTPRYRNIERALTAAIDGGNYSVWNDAPRRIHADVLALLDKAIAAEESRS